MSDYLLPQKCLAEALGTFMLVGGGCGVVCAIRYANLPANPMTVPVIFGLAVTLAIYSTGDISGAHINPAMTAAFAVNRPESFPKAYALPYMAAQMLGATAAGAINYLLYNRGIKALESSEKIIRGTKGSASSFNGAFGMIPNPILMPQTWLVVLAEFAMTSALSFTIFALTDEESSVPPSAAPALIGATVTGLVAQFAPVTGCGMNPARDLGPRIITAFCGWGKEALSKAWWAYTVGPMAGAVFGGALYNYTIKKKKKETKH